MMWRQGAYIYHALVCVAPYFNSFKPQRPEEYIRPFLYKESPEEKEKAENAQMQKSVAAFQVWADQFNRNRNNGGQ